MCKHETWNKADCVTPKTCAECGETEGVPLGHVWIAATCDAPKTCETCGVTEGEVKGHSWVEASCAAPKNCTACGLTEGEALEHIWEEATTEAPKTCTLCALTEGERIITDPRFTTAATADLYGTWTSRLEIPSEMFGIEGFEGKLTISAVMSFANDGTLGIGYTAVDATEFSAGLEKYLVDTMYAEMESFGFTKEEADAGMIEAYGVDIPTYAAAVMQELDIAAVFESLSITGVYYVDGDKLYTGLTWDTELGESSFTLEGDTMTLAEEISGLSDEAMVFTRSAD
jgi:hypothetical protein